MDRWGVSFTGRAAKMYAKLDQVVQEQVADLLRDISIGGPMRPEWPSFSKIGKSEYHCHVKKGRPTYVVCWRVTDKPGRQVEVYYAGTHQGAPY